MGISIEWGSRESNSAGSDADERAIRRSTGEYVRRNDTRKEYDGYKEEQAEGEIVQKWIGHHVVVSAALTARSKTIGS
jgi:hypothetical protein